MAWAQEPMTKDQISWEQERRFTRLRLPQVNNEELRTQELALRGSPERVSQFAKALGVNITPEKDGHWDELPGEMNRWRLLVESPGAYSLNFGFNRFKLPKGAVFTLTSRKTGEKAGPFTPADNEEHGELWTPVVEGDAVLLEITLPKPLRRDLEILLSNVNHDFINFKTVLSADCHVDVACTESNGAPQISAYRNVISSVGLISLKGTGICTGFLVNNTRQDCKPYFVTAWHCQNRSSDAPSLVVYWNYQNSRCRPSDTAENARSGDGKFDVFNTGTIQRATFRSTDFTLLELDDPVVGGANAYFAGWARDETPATGGVACIHHASTDEKRFSYSGQLTYWGNWGQAISIATGNHLLVPRWEVGSTEDGSSGAPLFNNRAQVVGQLHGGTAACGNSGYDSFGAIKSSWEGGGTSTNRLRDWLDPIASRAPDLSGRWEYQCRLAIETDLENRQICVPGTAVWNLRLSTSSPVSTRFSLLNLPKGLNAVFSENPSSSGQTRLSISADANMNSGFYPITVLAVIDKDTTSRLLFLNIVRKPEVVRLISPGNGSPSVELPVNFQWRKVPGATGYKISIARDAQFRNMLGRFEHFDTLFQLSRLDLQGTFFWRVNAVNLCDTSGTLGETFSFTIAPNTKLSLLAQSTKICPSDSLRLNLRVGEGYTGPVNLSYRLSPNFPMTLRFSQDPRSVTPGALLQINSAALKNLPPGEYRLTISSNQGTFRDSSRLIFRVSGLPAAPLLQQPGDKAYLLDDLPRLNWNANLEIRAYHLDIARDVNFQDMIFKTDLQTNTYQLSETLAAGRYFWRVKASGECGEKSSEVQSFVVFRSNLLELNGILFGIEPIPSTGLVRVRLSDIIEEASIELYSASGQLMQKIEIKEPFAEWPIDCSNFPSGVYLVRLRNRQSSATQRIVIQR
jgi:lysyl endopeptidase